MGRVVESRVVRLSDRAPNHVAAAPQRWRRIFAERALVVVLVRGFDDGLLALLALAAPAPSVVVAAGGFMVRVVVGEDQHFVTAHVSVVVVTALGVALVAGLVLLVRR